MDLIRFDTGYSLVFQQHRVSDRPSRKDKYMLAAVVLGTLSLVVGTTYAAGAWMDSIIDEPRQERPNNKDLENK